MTHDLPAAVSDLLRRAPGNWSEVPRDLSQTEQEALAALTAAGFVERRVGFSIRLPGQEQTQRITIELSGEYGLAEAMAAAVQDWWARWGRQWKDLKRDTGEPIRPVVTRDADYWRLTADGLLAKTDLAQGSTAPIDFVLKRGFFDGRPRLLADGRTVRREPVRGYGKLVSIENAPTGPLAVTVSNWAEGAQAFASALCRQAVARGDSQPPDTKESTPARVFLGGNDLAAALNVPKHRYRTFLRAVERLRRPGRGKASRLADTDYEEVQNPRPNTPRFKYRANHPAIVALAKRFHSK